ncbi:MAG: DNA recombination protein RmuC [Candidatus Omnitrophica bacterium]|nr:DNA recombination protein RmuC [Candidatus Omnitrophota bacterium]
MYTYIITALLVMMSLAVFYLIIRTKDLGSNMDTLCQRLGLTDDMRRQASDTIASLNERMVILNQKAQQINDVMNEVRGLKNLFIMPKGAGGAGERILEKTLHDVLSSDMYQAQYKLTSGTVDFVIKFKDNIVPLDSKLSSENFNKMLAAPDENSKRLSWRAFTNDVKKRIDETSKYILPNEKTTDFALMYIPSESVYYEAFIMDRHFGDDNILIDYAIKKRVYPVSPQTIYPYLVTIVQGMKALKIEENAKDILGKVSGLRNDFERFRTIYNIIINHIKDAYNKHDSDAQSSMARLDQHISSLEQKSG